MKNEKCKYNILEITLFLIYYYKKCKIRNVIIFRFLKFKIYYTIYYMSCIKVIKYGGIVDIDDLNNLPDGIEVLYIPYFACINDFNYNFPTSLKILIIGSDILYPDEKYKLPFDCKLIKYNNMLEYKNCYYIQQWTIYKRLFNEIKLNYKNNEILYLKSLKNVF